MRNKARAAVLVLALLTASCGPGSGAARGPQADKPALGLFTTLPLVWGEHGDLGAMIDGAGEPDPARLALEGGYRLEPLDLLDPVAIAPLDRLLLVQPRVLSGAENVALDDWVRAGGHALIFADPLLTRHSIYPIGDKRRPQDTVILSPILARWGLALEDPGATAARTATVLGAEVAVHYPGRFTLVAHDAPGTCALEAEGLVARCSIEKGTVTLVADAAAFDELVGGSPEAENLLAIVRAGLAD